MSGVRLPQDPRDVDAQVILDGICTNLPPGAPCYTVGLRNVTLALTALLYNISYIVIARKELVWRLYIGVSQIRCRCQSVCVAQSSWFFS